MTLGSTGPPVDLQTCQAPNCLVSCKSQTASGNQPEQARPADISVTQMEIAAATVPYTRTYIHTRSTPRSY